MAVVRVSIITPSFRNSSWLKLCIASVADQGVDGAARFRDTGAYATLFALAGVRWGVSVEVALSAYLFAFAENQVLCAIKLVPLGQSAGQRVLARIIGRVDGWVAQALSVDDADNGSYAPGLALASALHETQYSRLFRS